MAEHNQSQEEYNELLGVTKSLIGQIKNDLDALDASTDKRNKKLSQQISLTKSVIDSIEDEKDLQSLINLLKTEESHITKQNYGINQKLTGALLAQTSALQGILQKQRDTKKILNNVNSIVDGMSEKFGGVFDTIHHGLEHIPLIGEKLADMFHPFAENSKRMVGLVAEKFKMGFSRSFQSALASGKSFTSATFSGITKGFGDSIKLAGRFAGMLGPIGWAMLAIAAGAALGYERFHEVEKAATEFKTQTGIAVADLHEIEHTIGKVSNHYAYLGVSVSDASEYMQQFTEAADDLTIPLESTVASMAVLNKNFGVVATEAAKVNKIFQNMAGLSETQAQYMANTVVEMSNMVGVSPQKVMKDIADNAAESYKYFRGSPQQLAKAAVYAARMGTSIENMNKSSEKLLNFEQSISDELEASALIGQDLNFGRARELAYVGDQLGMQEELNKQLAGMRDINSMSVYEKEALVNASGQELDTLLNTQRIYKRFGNLDRERLAAANELVGKGLDLNDVSDEELEAQTERLAKQQEMQDMMTGMGNRLSAIGTAMSDAFAPVASVLMKGLAGAVKILSAVLIPLFQGLGVAIKIALWPIEHIGLIFQKVIDFVKEYYDYMVAAGIGAGVVYAWQQKTAIQMAYNNGLAAIGAGWSQAKALWAEREVLMSKAGAVAETAWNVVKAAGAAIMNGNLLKGIADMAISAFSSVAKIPYIGPILGAAAAAAAWGLGKSYFSKAGDVYSPADGKTQISTKEGGLFELSKNDDVLAGPGLGEAMKNAGGTTGIVATAGGETGGAVAGLVNSMIDEIRGLRSDLISGKVAVYMDGRKVTAAVATKVNEDPTTTKR